MLLGKYMSAAKIGKLLKVGAQIGENTLLFSGVESFGSEPYLIHIGDNCLITSGVKFITHDGAIRVINKNEAYKHIDNKYGRIDILDNVFIGENSIIMPNVTIGPNACVLPGSVVYKDVPPNSVSCGNPARTLNTIDNFEEYYRREIYQYYQKYYGKYFKHLM